ncbi:hypothetical protein IHE31_03920 [Mycetohabitans rhizoxinica]
MDPSSSRISTPNVSYPPSIQTGSSSAPLRQPPQATQQAASGPISNLAAFSSKVREVASETVSNAGAAMANCCLPLCPSSSSGSEGENRPLEIQPIPRSFIISNLLNSDGENPLKSYQTTRSQWSEGEHRAHSQRALDIAKNALASKQTGDEQASNDLEKMNEGLCWNVPRYCAVQAEIISEAESKSMGNMSGSFDLISLDDSKVTSAEALKAVKPGDVIGFFNLKRQEEHQLIHVMISSGEGKAIGRGNGCLVNDPRKMEELADTTEIDLVALFKGQWTENGEVTPQNLVLAHRPISEIGKIPSSAQPSGQASTSAQPSNEASTSAQA